MEIKITPEAHNDILSIYDYVKKDGAQVARNQANYIYNGIEQLGEFPNIGIPLQKHVERKTNLKYLVIRKVYIIVFDVREFVEILRVFRKEQDFISDLGFCEE